MLAKYAIFGIIPVVIPPLFLDAPIPIKEIPTQTGTDLDYIQKLAQQNGYVFFIDPGPVPGTNTAYWGPEFVLPNPQPALRVNMDANSNVDSLSFSLDGLAKKIVVLTIMDPVSKKIPIPIPVPNTTNESRILQGRYKTRPGEGRGSCPGKDGSFFTCHHGLWAAECVALRTDSQGATDGGGLRGRTGLRRSLLRQERYQQH
jgi:hypothetical protein